MLMMIVVLVSWVGANDIDVASQVPAEVSVALAGSASDVTVQFMQPYSLACSAANGSVASYAWEQGGRLIEGATGHALTVANTNASGRTDGRFTCVAVGPNGARSPISEPAVVSVSRLPVGATCWPPTFRFGDAAVLAGGGEAEGAKSAVAGDSGRFTCEPPLICGLHGLCESRYDVVTASGLAVSLLVNGLVALCALVAWYLLRSRHSHVYTPRTVAPFTDAAQRRPSDSAVPDDNDNAAFVLAGGGDGGADGGGGGGGGSGGGGDDTDGDLGAAGGEQMVHVAAGVYVVSDVRPPAPPLSGGVGRWVWRFLGSGAPDAPSVSSAGSARLAAKLGISEERLALLSCVGLDAMLMLDFSRYCAVLFAGLAVVGLVILVPVHVHGGGQLTGLDQLTLANVSTGSDLFWFHALLAWMLSLVCVYAFVRFYRDFVHLSVRCRQQTYSVDGRSLLVSGLRLQSGAVTHADALRDYFGRILGDPRRVKSAFVRDEAPGGVERLVAENNELVVQLERACVHMAREQDGLPSGSFCCACCCGGTCFCFCGGCGGGRCARGAASVDKPSASGDDLGAGGVVGDPATSDAELRCSHADAAAVAAEEATGTGTRRPRHRLGCCGKRVDSLSHLQAELDRVGTALASATLCRKNSVGPALPLSPEPADTDADVAVASSSSSSAAAAAEVPSVGFVTLDSMVMAQTIGRCDMEVDIGQMYVLPAPEPRDVYWAGATVRSKVRDARKLLASVLLVILVIFWGVPVGFSVSLANLESLEQRFTWLGDFMSNQPQWFRNFVAGFLPAVVLAIFMGILPQLVLALAKLRAHVSFSALHRSQASQLYAFQAWNVFFVATAAGALFERWQEISEHPSEIFNVLAETIPAQSSFFINYVMLLAVSGQTMQLLQVVNWFKRGFFKLRRSFVLTSREHTFLDLPRFAMFGQVWPEILLVLLLGLVYALFAPLLLVFVSLYFAVSFCLWKHQFMYVYRPQYQTSGRIAGVVMRRVWLGLFIAQGTLIGVLTLNNAYAQMIVCSPLPLVTLLAAVYTHRTYDHAIKQLPLAFAAAADEAARGGRGEAVSPYASTLDTKLLHPSEDVVRVLGDAGRSSAAYEFPPSEGRRSLISAQPVSENQRPLTGGTSV